MAITRTTIGPHIAASDLATVDTVDAPQPLGTVTPGVGPGASPADHVHTMPALGNLAGVSLTGLAAGDSLRYNGSSWVRHRPPIWNSIGDGELTVPRTAGMSDFIAPASSAVHHTFFRATTATVAARITFQTGSAGVATPTLARVGLYLVDESTGALTLVASSANRAAGFTGTYTTYSEAFTATYTLIPGSTYAVAILQVATTPANLLGVWSNNQFIGLRPRLSAVRTSQSDLPSSSTDANLGDHQLAVFAAVRS